MGNLHISETPEAVAQSFAQYLSNQINGQTTFNIALSGGSTPKLLFKILSKDFRTRINWEIVHFYWGDERCVPPADDESNFKMTKDLLFDPLNIPASNIHRIRGEVDPQQEASRYSKEILKNLPIRNMLPKFDLIILGMGEDGHTASIFPHQMELLQVDRICEVANHPETGQRRVTITGKTLNNAENIAFLLTGSGKRPKIESIFSADSASKSYPASYIQPGSGQLHWFMDKAAYPE